MSESAFVDIEMLIEQATKMFDAATTEAELNDIWAQIVRPVYDQLSETTLAILQRFHANRAALLLARKK